jgi:hypothetical protein
MLPLVHLREDKKRYRVVPSDLVRYCMVPQYLEAKREVVGAEEVSISGKLRE